MTTIDRTAELVRMPLKMRLLAVKRATRPTPRLVRVVLTGDLADFRSPDADDHVKVFFPAPGATDPAVPTYEPDGIKLPADGSPLIARDYTPRHFDPAAGELTLDFVIHGDGPASAWAEAAAPGARLGVAGPRGSRVVPHTFDWYLLIGDETFLPSIGRRLAELPAGARALALIEVADAADEQPLTSAADLTVRWLHRDGAAAGTTDLLLGATRALDFPAGDGHIWVAGEAGSLRALRRHIARERAHPREWTHFSGHWKRGEANHDHHAPLDE